MCYNEIKEESVELKKRLSLRTVLIGLYVVVFGVYVIWGLQPAEAAKSYEISTKLNIPSINLTTDVATLQLENRELKTPDAIVGSFSRADNKTLLIGHSTTVFQNLNNVKIGDEINYNNGIYVVKNIKVLEKANVDMSKILAPAEKQTLEIMTCIGDLLDGGDATHRLIITAEIKD